ncbi:MAG: FecR domain-containing protein, partial [Myxococcota bacterium]
MSAEPRRGFAPPEAGPAGDSLRAINEAAAWYARLLDRRGDAALDAQWRAWRAADPAHEEAWRKVEAVSQRMGRVPGRIAAPVLGAAMSRRTVLRNVVLLASAGTVGWAASRQIPWQAWSADYRTAIGERREVRLADGSRLLLNTGSAVDVRFDADQRLITLHEGEILIATAADPQAPGRPFRVRTEQGTVTALGTQFTVRRRGERSEVIVLEKAVEVAPADAPSLRTRVAAGQRIDFTRDTVGGLRDNDPSAGSWQNGRLTVVDMPLSELIEELGRYRTGYLGCDAAVGRLRVSGV